MDRQSALSSFLTSTLPKLRELDPLLEALQELGVHDLEDLNYIQESDLLHVLKPVEARKLISHFKTTSMCLYLMQLLILRTLDGSFLANVTIVCPLRPKKCVGQSSQQPAVL